MRFGVGVLMDEGRDLARRGQVLLQAVGGTLDKRLPVRREPVLGLLLLATQALGHDANLERDR